MFLTLLTSRNPSILPSVFLFLGALLLGPTPALAGAAVCPCDFFAVPGKEFSKFGIVDVVCLTDNVDSDQSTNVRATNRKDGVRIEMFAQIFIDEKPSTRDRCFIELSRGRFKRAYPVKTDTH